jgi:hypothetical protein
MDEHRTALKRAGPTLWTIIVLGVVVVGAMVGVRLWGDRGATPAPAHGVPGVTPGGSVASTDSSDAGATARGPEVAALLDRISPDALFRRSVAASDWVRRWAVVTDNLAEGVSPRRELAFAAPGKSFTVEKRGADTVIAAESYRRYDAFADAVASVNVDALAALYRAVHGPIQAAYRALGYPSAPFDAVVSRALHRIEAAPVVDRDVGVRDDGGVFVFQETRLESLRDVEKHLLRMGPRNTRLLQAKAVEIRQALALPAPGSTARGR